MASAEAGCFPCHFCSLCFVTQTIIIAIKIRNEVYLENVITLTYEGGTILANEEIPNSVYDPRVKMYRVKGMFYRQIKEYLIDKEYDDKCLEIKELPELKLKHPSLRDYQKEAIEAWIQKKWGTVVLPTGAGKTLVALKIMEMLNVPTLIITPTLELVSQWERNIKEGFNYEPGIYTGETKEIREITVTTYASAYLSAEYLGNKFLLLVFDEVHHLPSPSYSQIGEYFLAPYRLGLTATFEREDGLHEMATELVGEVVYRGDLKEMSGKHLAPFEIKRIYVDLDSDEKEEYNKYWKIYTEFLKKEKIRGEDMLEKLIRLSGRSKEAREALLARMYARRIAFGSRAKYRVLKELLMRHRGEKIIIFTEQNEQVYEIAKKFLIPFITHETKKKEREHVLDSFRNGDYTVIATSKVLNEGVDVPDASVGIILGGSGSKREYVQRLGRILRKSSKDKSAVLYEVISRTVEIGTARRRRKGV